MTPEAAKRLSDLRSLRTDFSQYVQFIENSSRKAGDLKLDRCLVALFEATVAVEEALSQVETALREVPRE